MMYQSKLPVIPDFMNKKAPPNYIAGLGRGATGFTTRSDIGPAREISEEDRSAISTRSYDDSNQLDERGDTFNDPNGEMGLFSSAPYEADDEEADRVYERIDKKMDERRKARREERERTELEEYRRERPKIHQSFAELKRSLLTLSESDWNNIPEVGDLVRQKEKKQKRLAEKYTPIPDSVILEAAEQESYANAIGTATPFPKSEINDGTITDFAQFGQARDKVLGLKLDQISDSVSGKSTIDPKGYLTDLNSLVLKTDSEISDIKKARLLLNSVTMSNPKHASGWLAAARLEEFAGKYGAARKIISKGCEECPTSEDLWLEAVRLNTKENAKVILARAVQHIPQSVKIWLRAADLETDSKSKRRVLIRSLEFIPSSAKLWKELISREDDPEDARILLSRAVQCAPQAVELWLALVRLETYENAKKTLNEARKANPTNKEIWITAAKLEEMHGNKSTVETILSRAVSWLKKMGALMDREMWIKEAEKAGKEDYPLTCKAIIKETIGLGLNDEELKSTWMEDAENCINNNSIQTARNIYEHALTVFPEKKGIWRRAAFLEKTHGTRENLEKLLERAVSYCPQAEVLWLMRAKEKWLADNVPAAREILSNAFEANPNSESIWLAAIKLEVETREYERARKLLASARNRASTEKVWMKSAVLERILKNHKIALELLEKGIKLYPSFDKLWIIKAQIEENELASPDLARNTYASAMKAVPNSHTVRILASRLEIAQGCHAKARVILEKARIANPKCPEVWLETVRAELKLGNYAMARTLMSKALQECPDSSVLHADAVLMEPRSKRKSAAAEALKKCENAPHILAIVAKLFAQELKFEKARNWFSRATKTDPDLGDIWASWLKFELAHGTEETQQMVIDRCIAAEPRHGEYWQSVAKDINSNIKGTADILKAVSEKLPDAIE